MQRNHSVENQDITVETGSNTDQNNNAKFAPPIALKMLNGFAPPQ